MCTCAPEVDPAHPATNSACPMPSARFWFDGRSTIPRPTQHCTHEARGLDVLPQTIHRFRSNGDGQSADLLQVWGAELLLAACMS